MKSTILTIFFLFLFLEFGYSQGDNCAAPKVINICPEIKLTGETTAGFTNDKALWKNNASVSGLAAVGNDVVYQINVPPGTLQIYISIANATGSFYVFQTGNVCNPTYYNSATMVGASSNIILYPSGTGPFYLWIDHNNSFDISYDITFGAVTSITNVNFIKGQLRTSWNCINPIFKKDLEITYNGIHQAYPLVYPALGTAGVVCSKIYMQNLIGDEGVKKFTFAFGPDMTNLSPVSSSLPGFYNTGTWTSTQVGSVITWNFADAAGTGKGDFTGAPNGCLEYSFCYNVTPTSNTKAGTKVTYSWQGDNWGPSKSYKIYNGCSSVPNKFLGSSCLSFPCSVNGSSGGAAASGSGSFDDPFLPVALLDFSVKKELQENIIQWQTAEEINVSHFEIERSSGDNNFESIAHVISTGANSSYKISVKNILPAIEYYRLRMVNINGSFEYSPVIRVSSADANIIKIFPNPANSVLKVESIDNIEETMLTDLFGKQVRLAGIKTGLVTTYDISDLQKGIYCLSIRMNNYVNTSKLIIE